jgi:hypothetical protein
LRTAATALALLSFLMAGDTHVKGDHQEEVRRGLEFLTSRADETSHGDNYSELGGTMYSHGLATQALCVAYGLTRDLTFNQRAQEAIRYTSYAQDPVGGGWRYQPRTPGDTSVTGWQMLALRSGHMGYFRISAGTIRRVPAFLDSVQGGSWHFGYTQPSEGEVRPSTTAIGLFCRMSTGWKRDNPNLQQGVGWLASQGPDPNNAYFNFFATHAMRAYGGRMWDLWHPAIQTLYQRTQATAGHEAGSWYFEGGGHGSQKAGRLYCTTMALMTLQVQNHYRCLYGDVTQ